MYHDPVTSFDVGPCDERTIAYGRRNKEGCRLEKLPFSWYELQTLLARRHFGGEGPLWRSKPSVARLIFKRMMARQSYGCSEVEDSKLCAGHPWQRRLVSVLAPDLQEVGEVGCCAVDSNEILVEFGSRVGQRSYWSSSNPYQAGQTYLSIEKDEKHFVTLRHNAPALLKREHFLVLYNNVSAQSSRIACHHFGPTLTSICSAGECVK